MSTMNISLPDTLKAFVDDQVSQRGYSTSSEYVRELIRKDQDRQHLRGLLLAGAESAPTAPADGDYFESLRSRARKSEARHPTSGIGRYAHELELPGLLCRPLKRYPIWCSSRARRSHRRMARPAWHAGHS